VLVAAAPINAVAISNGYAYGDAAHERRDDEGRSRRGRPSSRSLPVTTSYVPAAAAWTSGSEGSVLDVLTPSWFGVDRVEIYLNGDLRRVVLPESEPEDIVDVHGKVTLTLPDRDSWVIVIAMGLDDENLLGPISLDVPFGEVQLSKRGADAFGKIPVVNEIFNAPPTAPDWTPIAPLAITNPIYVDVGGNGRYDAPLPPPDFCSRPCDPGAGGADCPTGQTCLSKERLCGFEIAGRCERRVASGHGH
jgi:hypothetical protein